MILQDVYFNGIKNVLGKALIAGKRYFFTKRNNAA
jgi:hypothetical protein